MPRNSQSRRITGGHRVCSIQINSIWCTPLCKHGYLLPASAIGSIISLAFGKRRLPTTAFARSLGVLADHGMLHQMAQGSLSCRRVAHFRSIAGLILLAIGWTNCAFAAAKDEKIPAAGPSAAKPADNKAEKPPADLGDGRLIRVRLPLAGNDDAHIKSSIQRAMAQLAVLQ